MFDFSHIKNKLHIIQRHQLPFVLSFNTVKLLLQTVIQVL